nr:site-specific integrase [Pseudalkalibacillus hwajinpoensis]
MVCSSGYDQNGKRKKRTKTVKCKNKSKARIELAKFITEIEAGEYIAPEKMVFGRFVEEWMNKYALKDLAPTTIAAFNTHLQNRILPYFSHMRLDQIKTIHIINYLASLEKAGRKDGTGKPLSSSTIEYNHRVLRNIFQRAVDWQLIKSSPVASVKKPKVTQKEVQVYNEADVIRLFKCLQGERAMWRMLISLAVTGGLRRGELLGLEWKHIDFEKSTIQIKQTVSHANGEYVVREPKTANSRRTISIPGALIEELKSYKKNTNRERIQAGELWEGGEHYFLFSSWNGKPLYPSSVTTWWRSFTKRNKLSHIKFHALRHTSATLLINKGVHAKTISSRLGHADIRTTMNIYGHALQEADQVAANHYDSLFEGKQKTDTK